MDMRLKSGSKWTYKDHTYTILEVHEEASEEDEGNFVKVKDPNDSNWYPAILYHDPNDDKLFIRRTDDFIAKFKPVE